MTYTTEDSLWLVSLDPGSQTLGVQVSFWDGDDFQIRYDKRVIADSWHEAITGALVDSGFEWEAADYQVSSWGITPPDDEEESN